MTTSTTTVPDRAAAAAAAAAASQQASYVAMMNDNDEEAASSVVAIHGSNSSNSNSQNNNNSSSSSSQNNNNYNLMEPTTTTILSNNNNSNKPTTTTLSFREEIMDLLQELMHFNQRRSWKKKVLTVFMIVSTCLVVVDLLFLGNIIHWIRNYAAWMSVHVLAGTVWFIVLMTVCTLIMIPPSILIFVCGYVYTQVCGGIQQGIPAAILASFAGCALGAVLAFVRARYMMRDLVNLFANRYKIIRAADRAIKHHGFRVMLLLRLCPIVPFNGLNYIGGITDVSMEDFCLSLVGILPLTVLTVVMGATAEQFYVGLNQFDETTTAERKAHLSMIVAGLVFVLVAVCITVYFARKELDREIRAELEAENAKLAVGRNNDNIDLISSSDQYSQQGMLDEVQVELQYADYEEGVDDEEWFWLYS